MTLQLFDPALLAYVDEQREYNRQIMEATAAMASIDKSTIEGIRWIREAMAPGGLFGLQAYDFPETREVAGVPVRVLTPDRVRGVYLHFHGGAMTVGSAASMDPRNWGFAQALDVAVLSVDYRLAPEHPYPGGPDDCEAVALWLLEHAVAEFGTDRLLVGGESAGAYFTLLTMLRLRDRLGARPPYLAMDLCYGGYDMSATPSTQQMVGKVPYATGDGNRVHYLPGRSLEALRDPAVSPMWAELHDLPSAIVTVGTADWLIDDNLFIANRMALAGNELELAVYPEGCHGIESAPTTMGKIAQERIHSFLRARLDGPVA